MEYLLSVSASTLGGEGVYISRSRAHDHVVVVITGTTARCVRNVMQNRIAQFAGAMRLKSTRSIRLPIPRLGKAKLRDFAKLHRETTRR